MDAQDKQQHQTPPTTQGGVNQDTQSVEQGESKLEVAKQGCIGGTIAAFNRPWLIISIALLLGGLWLINNTWVITDNWDKPYTMWVAPILIGSLLACWLIIMFFKAIVTWCRATWKAFQAWRKGEGSTYWQVIAIFLIVSVLEAGGYFNELLGPASLYNALGFAVALVIDLVAVECMRARQGATRMRDKMGQRLYLLGVIACAALSAYANTYTALKHYVHPEHTLLPGWMISIAPWTGMAFPLLIIFLSFAGDYTADQSSSKLDPASYEASERRRMKLLEIQRDMLRERVAIDQEIDELTATLRGGKEQRRFILVHLFLWVFFPKVRTDEQRIVDKVKKEYEPQLKEMAKLSQQIMSQFQQFTIQTRQTYGQMAQQLRSIDAQKDADNAIIMQQITGVKQEVIGLVERQFTNAIGGLETRLLASFNQQDNMPVMQRGKPSKKPAYPSASEEAISENNFVLDDELQEVVANYPIVEQWLSRSARTVALQEVISGTGHTPQMVHKRAKDGTFRGTRRDGYYRLDSVITWLKSAPLPKSKEATNSPDNEGIIGPNTGEIQQVVSPTKESHNGNHNGHNYIDVHSSNFVEMTA